MLGMLFTSVPSSPSMRSCWTYWIDSILKQRGTLGMRKAALLSSSSGAVIASSGWSLSDADIANLHDPHLLTRTRDTIQFDGKTYVIKKSEAGQLVAFNGGSYLIVTKSKSMQIVALCQSKSKSTKAATWLRHLRNQLVASNY